MSHLRHVEPFAVLLVVAVVAIHILAPVLHGLSQDYVSGVLAGFVLGMVLGYVADHAVLRPTVDLFESRRHDR